MLHRMRPTPPAKQLSEHDRQTYKHWSLPSQRYATSPWVLEALAKAYFMAVLLLALLNPPGHRRRSAQQRRKHRTMPLSLPMERLKVQSTLPRLKTPGMPLADPVLESKSRFRLPTAYNGTAFQVDL